MIALVLLPLFYKLELVSIYTWLETRFGEKARLIGSFFLYHFSIGRGFLSPVFGCRCVAVGFF